MTYLIQFAISMAAVFLKGFQHQNVIGGKYVPAFFMSYLMAVTEVVTVTLVVQNGWASVMPVGTGAAIGIVASMWAYRRLDRKGKL